jgi:hypothetical protein
MSKHKNNVIRKKIKEKDISPFLKARINDVEKDIKKNKNMKSFKTSKALFKDLNS